MGFYPDFHPEKIKRSVIVNKDFLTAYIMDKSIDNKGEEYIYKSDIGNYKNIYADKFKDRIMVCKKHDHHGKDKAKNK